MRIEMTGLADIVRQHASQRPDAAAIVHAGRTTTYGALDRASNRVANGLIAEGIGPQVRVAHLDKSSDIFFELLFGTAKANAVMVSVNWRLAPPEVSHILNDAQAEILFVGEEYFPVIEKIRDELKTVRKIVAFGARHGTWKSFSEWCDRQSAADPHLPVRSGDTAVQFYTSGTTGLPKGAELTNANFAWMFPLWTRTWLLAPGVPNLVCLPMFHIGGAGWGIAGLFAGATNHVVREFVPAEILQIIQRERLQVMLLVPAMILFLVQAPQIRETDLSSLRLIVYGAAPIPAELLKQAMGIFPCGFQQVYGLTETTGAITLLPPDDHDPSDARKLLSCGYAQSGVELRIVGDDGRDLPTGTVGEIAVRSPQIMHGYWRLVLDRRRGLPRRQGLPLHLRPGEGHDRVGRREHLSGRDRERAVRPSRRGRCRRDRRPRRALGRGGQGHRREDSGRRHHGWRIARLGARTDRWIQAAEVGRLHRDAAAQSDRQD